MPDNVNIHMLTVFVLWACGMIILNAHMLTGIAFVVAGFIAFAWPVISPLTKQKHKNKLLTERLLK